MFLKEGLRFEGFQNTRDEAYIKGMNNFKHSWVLKDLERKLREVSHDVNASKAMGDFNTQKEKLFNEYLTLVRELNPFCPFISEKVIKDLSYE